MFNKPEPSCLSLHKDDHVPTVIVGVVWNFFFLLLSPSHVVSHNSCNTNGNADVQHNIGLIRCVFCLFCPLERPFNFVAFIIVYYTVLSATGVVITQHGGIISRSDRTSAPLLVVGTNTYYFVILKHFLISHSYMSCSGIRRGMFHGEEWVVDMQKIN